MLLFSRLYIEPMQQTHMFIPKALFRTGTSMTMTGPVSPPSYIASPGVSCHSKWNEHVPLSTDRPGTQSVATPVGTANIRNVSRQASHKATDGLTGSLL